MLLTHLFLLWRLLASVLGLILALASCSIHTSQAPSGSPAPAANGQSASEGRQVDLQHAERLKMVMIPLLEKMTHPIPLDRVRIGLMDDSHINAANAGGGEFYVTTGLLLRANDEQLAGVLAHEVAHADLGHVSKLQRIGTGTNIAAILLSAFGVPGAGLLQLTGRDGERIMAATLTWLMKVEGAGAGGIFATHPATVDRIHRVQGSRPTGTT